MTSIIWKIKLSISLFALCSLFGCASILKKNYGYNDPSKFNEVEYKKFISAIDTSQMHFLQSSIGQFKQVINLGKDSLRKKDLNQPVQLLYFDNSTLISYHANCYAKGTVSGVDWNYEKRFNSFPPKSAIESSLFDLNITHFSKIYSEITPRRKYTILVFWSWMVEGISKSAISTLQNNIKDNKVENDVEIFLINIDAFWSGSGTSK